MSADNWTHCPSCKNAEQSDADAKVIAEWRDAEHSLSDAYVRLRAILKAFDTPEAPSGERVWAHTESRARELVAELEGLRAACGPSMPCGCYAVEMTRHGIYDIDARVCCEKHHRVHVTPPDYSVWRKSREGRS